MITGFLGPGQVLGPGASREGALRQRVPQGCPWWPRPELRCSEQSRGPGPRQPTPGVPEGEGGTLL